ncbi:GNAT family N-acetyltransferase [Streptococcus caprae]|uniref:GNAT family N-acetyltransferase n=1 Tax=Streptococcus caprae TaxID=1640501 RepID=A0ABV8CVU0_9STRE
MDIRKIQLSDQAAYQRFEQAVLEDKNTNPFVEWWAVDDFEQFVANSDRSEVKKDQQTWSPFTRYFAFIEGEIAGFVICFWEIDHPDCLKLGHIGYLVAPNFRRQGIATTLIQFALQQYVQRGISTVLVVTDEINTPCRNLVEHLGGQLFRVETIDYFDKAMTAACYELSTEEP